MVLTLCQRSPLPGEKSDESPPQEKFEGRNVGAGKKKRKGDDARKKTCLISAGGVVIAGRVKEKMERRWLSSRDLSHEQKCLGNARGKERKGGRNL